MSAIKRYLEDEIGKIASETGYDEDFLTDAYNFSMDIGLTFDEFKEMALDHKFDGFEFSTF